MWTSGLPQQPTRYPSDVSPWVSGRARPCEALGFVFLNFAWSRWNRRTPERLSKLSVIMPWSTVNHSPPVWIPMYLGGWFDMRGYGNLSSQRQIWRGEEVGMKPLNM